MRRTPQEQVAFDSGDGQRAISHRHENPYSADEQPNLHRAWEDGWKTLDAKLSG